MADVELEKLYGNIILALEYLENCPEFSCLIPEVRSNLVYARKNAKNPDDVLGIEGRITIINGRPHASGRPKFGVSSHMARLIIEIMKTDPTIRSGINFACSERIITFIEKYAREKNLTVCPIDRSDEPEKIKETEKASAEWKVAKMLKITTGQIPKLCYEFGAIGKEDLFYLVGTNPTEVVKDICDIARRYIKDIGIV
ncbi:MAG: thiamine-phosphate synthase family protein [bacterium]